MNIKLGAENDLSEHDRKIYDATYEDAVRNGANERTACYLGLMSVERFYNVKRLREKKASEITPTPKKSEAEMKALAREVINRHADVLQALADESAPRQAEK